MEKTAEQKMMIQIPGGGKALRTNILEEGKTVEIIYKSNTRFNNEFEEMFPIVKASTLFLEDEFLKHIPESDKQIRCKKHIIMAIKMGVSDFRAPIMDPSFEGKEKICYKAGMKPAVKKSPEWWDKNFRDFMPSKNSRMGNFYQRYAFLAILIKYLIEEGGYTVGGAWKAVCDDSTKLGHYSNSKDAKHDFEPTASRQIGKWFDLTNTEKITTDIECSGFTAFGGYCNYNGYHDTLSRAVSISYPDIPLDFCTGWLVLDV